MCMDDGYKMVDDSTTECDLDHAPDSTSPSGQRLCDQADQAEVNSFTFGESADTG